MNIVEKRDLSVTVDTSCSSWTADDLFPAGNALWDDFSVYMREQYGLEPEITMNAHSRLHKWTVQYIRDEKVICTVYPEEKRFIVLFVADPKEDAVIAQLESALSSYVRTLFTDTGMTPMGKCLLIQVTSWGILRDIKKLVWLKMSLDRPVIVRSEKSYHCVLPEGSATTRTEAQKRLFRKAYST